METQSEEMDEPSKLFHQLEDADRHVKNWLEMVENGQSLTPAVRALWKECVPKVFQLEKGENDVPHWPYNKHEKILFELLEHFMCGGDDLKSMMDRLTSPPLCGRTLKMGEPAYSCRECGTDPTCVLCAFCFKNSVHQHHKYKMHTSLGNGRCDCGDVEAWSSGPYCDTHKETKRKHDSDSNIFPDGVAQRSRAVFEIVQAYAFELLTHKHSLSLPSDLKRTEDSHLQFDVEDTYCVVLYNDESHTFDQVFEAMQRVMNDVYRDLVNRVDREGRAVIKVCSFQQCTEMKTEVERCTSRQHTQPLKVQVLHADVVAHQIFALKLLDWMESIVQTSSGFRREFSNVFLESSTSSSIAERVLMEDANMWIAARLAWHRLIMAGLLIEYDIKKSFSKIFTRRYGCITKEYIRDDHDRRVSVLSLSVQLYTLPTIAHYLVAEERALLILWNTIASEFNSKVKDNNKFAFERHSMSLIGRRIDPFFRILETFYDIKYLLIVEPKEWTDELRLNFLAGLSTMLDLMVHMQDMEPFKRQVGQHVEYEPEYETGFALHKSMAQIYPFVVDWCSTDRVVLIKAYRMVLSKLAECSPMDSQPVSTVIELANHSATCIVYDPAVEPVSIYLPLSRLLAGLHLALDKYGLHFDSPELQPAKQPKPTPHLLLEPVIRLQVMIAQVWAGMWRRNGFSILTQVAKYRSPSNRNEMQDRDICMIQICASLIESNEFLIILLHKFNLLKWADANFMETRDSESVVNTTRILEEFLGLLVILVTERYTPGVGMVTDDDQMKKEIIQLLCAGPLSHSELYRAFPFGHKHLQEARIESVIDEVADFKRPSNKVGVYELKEKHYADCNVFFYHFDAEDRTHAEEILRRKNKEKNGMDCCPPPPLPQLCPPFTMVLNLLQCDVMLHILKLILERSLHIGAQHSSELQLHMALHLIGHALQEQEKEPDGFLKFTERANNWNIEQLMEDLLNCAPLETLKDLLKWVLTKYRSVKEGSSSLEVVTPTPQTQVQQTTDKDKEWRAKMAAEKRARVMAQMTAMQKNFMKENASLFQMEKDSEQNVQEEDMDTIEISEKPPVAIGPNQTPVQAQVENYICILCQEEQAVSCSGTALVLAAYVQKSVVMARKYDESVPQHELFLSSYLGPAPYASTCGHVMHSTCWKQYYDNVQAKESRRPYRIRQPASFDIEHKEFLCPLCNCLSNTVLPLIPQTPIINNSVKMEKVPDTSIRNVSIGDTSISFKSWLIDVKKTPHLPHDNESDWNHAMELLDTIDIPPAAKQQAALFSTVEEILSGNNTATSAPLVTEPPKPSNDAAQPQSQPRPLPVQQHSEGHSSDEDDESTSHSDSEVKHAKRQLLEPDSFSAPCSSTGTPVHKLPKVKLSDDLVNMILRFVERIDEKCSTREMDGETEMSTLRAWQCCAYTIHSLEVLLRDEGKPLLGNLSLRQNDCLKGLVRMMAILTTAWSKPMLHNTHARMIFNLLLNINPDQGCLLDWDSFGVMVPLVFLMSKQTVPSGGGYEIYAFRLALFMEIMKALIYICRQALINGKKIEDDTMEVDEMDAASGESFESSDDFCPALHDLLILLHDQICMPTELLPSPKTVAKLVKEYCQPFLRCCVLFFHFLTTVPARDVLTTQGGDTFDNMCSYLGISDSWRNTIFDDTMQALVIHWANHPRVQTLFRKSGELEVFTSPLKINRLVPLPEDYSELLCSVLEFYCHDRVESRCPTMCLVCGEMLCSQTSCCVHRLDAVQVGSCTYHAVKCGAGCGLFLQVRRCQVLVLALPNRGTFMTPPYVDDYGETDQGLRRGNRLQLSPELYRELEHIWLSHGIREYVSRSMDKGAPQIAGQWHEL
ncbi:hypothetical protein FOCC_FOCC000653 [Frankliniella occidentalis]|uniref:E3 ubiquitin-protein ligase n=1 Tax=Frankliniella occidentalis TaxID=133901 RepID=A0A6J1RSX6_FRAOC|nr:E3 ubiquitin-protein ligase UBR2 [Frankliniella occidentalis]XP_052124778.1 E3 ubiquitin-protein ligase UBR2 [Frankliniella occidentalis]XP_052124785.1 E3 ubiquitin-protein ligase UBR2 [Frankliniella occidentalis]KAE8752531.1 hypothetical protein FOCC_FOCC000653 [Frankliniella occidentalis]